MTHQIHESINDLAIDIDLLLPLPGNPRIGNVEAIMASYEEFGQVKPIVVRLNDDGASYTVIAGNHQLEAAKRLGWTRIAAVQMDVDDKRAMAFALADNRTVELGYTEPELLHDILMDITDEYSSLLDGLGWDDFELAAMDELAVRGEATSLNDGYIAPVIVEPLPDASRVRLEIEVDEDGDSRIVTPSGSDDRLVAATGSSATGSTGSSKTVFQYTLVFDSAEDQRRWYDFIRWVKNQPAYEGDTTAAKLIAFIDSHSSF